MKYKLQKEPAEVLEMITASVTRARNHVADVEWSAEDGTRTEIDFLCRCVELAIKAGATTINIPDTVGYTVPEEYQAMFETVRNRVPNSDKAIFSVHCHNDLGLAVANSLAGVKGGARQIECTINGLGERAGNAALEEVVMAMHSARRPPALSHQHRCEHADAGLEARLGGLLLSRCSTIRRSSAATPSRMRAASIRTAC